MGDIMPNFLDPFLVRIQAMLSTIKSFFAPLLATIILTMGGGLLNSLLSVNMSLNGYSEQVIGLVMSCNYLGIVLGIFFCQPIVHRVGHIRAFAVFAAVITVIALLYGVYMTPWFWAFLRICNGLCITGLFIVIESWNHRFADDCYPSI